MHEAVGENLGAGLALVPFRMGRSFAGAALGRVMNNSRACQGTGTLARPDRVHPERECIELQKPIYVRSKPGPIRGPPPGLGGPMPVLIRPKPGLRGSMLGLRRPTPGLRTYKVTQKGGFQLPMHVIS